MVEHVSGTSRAMKRYRVFFDPAGHRVSGHEAPALLTSALKRASRFNLQNRVPCGRAAPGAHRGGIALISDLTAALFGSVN